MINEWCISGLAGGTLAACWCLDAASSCSPDPTVLRNERAICNHHSSCVDTGKGNFESTVGQPCGQNCLSCLLSAIIYQRRALEAKSDSHTTRVSQRQTVEDPLRSRRGSTCSIHALTQQSSAAKRHTCAGGKGPSGEPGATLGAPHGSLALSSALQAWPGAKVAALSSTTRDLPCWVGNGGRSK